MDPALQQHLPLAAVVVSAAALLFSLMAAFPGLKSVLAAVRDGVLWFALFLVLGGATFLAWQHIQTVSQAAATTTPSPGQLEARQPQGERDFAASLRP
jgi:hypothetical protein